MFNFLVFFIFILGLIIGSFLNCLIWRLHTEESLMGRSYCPKCKKQIFWYDNIPILSFLILRGKCRHCGKSISWQYPMVELVMGAMFAITFIINFQFPISNFQSINNFQFSNIFIIQLLRDWFLIAVMTVVFIYDFKWYLILDIVVLPACIIILILNLIIGDSSWLNLLFSGIIGGSFFLIQYIISKGKWIGGGDIRLGLLMGLALGWPNIIAGIILAYFIGSVTAIGLILAKKKQWGSQLPLGVFLAPATIIVLFWGDRIINWYINLL